MGKARRSTGTTRTFGEIRTAYSRDRREARQAADIAAVDRGETVTMIGSYRGTYGDYPKRFMGCYLDLTPDGLVIRPMLFFRQFRRRIPVTEQVIWARSHPFDNRRDAFGQLGAGEYAAGGAKQWSGRVPVTCMTSGGVLEFTVVRPDVELVLHYLGRLAGTPGPDS